MEYRAGVELRAAGEYLITLAGAIDMAAGPPLRSLVDACLEAGARLVRFDMRAVTFCDSTGVNLLVRAHRADVDVLVHPSARVLQVLEVAGVAHEIVRVELGDP